MKASYQFLVVSSQFDDDEFQAALQASSARWNRSNYR
jgi:hypothetical protein